VILDGLLADVHLRGDFFVGHALADHGHHVLFTSGEVQRGLFCRRSDSAGRQIVDGDAGLARFADALLKGQIVVICTIP
jgi:hypothetical protein